MSGPRTESTSLVKICWTPITGGISLCPQHLVRSKPSVLSEAAPAVPMLANLYLQGRLKLDELVSAKISLDQINDGFAAMQAGTVARSVVVF